MSARQKNVVVEVDGESPDQTHFPLESSGGSLSI